MNTKGFVILLVTVLVLGGGFGGAFAGGVALGKSQGEGAVAAPTALPARSTSGTGQQQSSQEQLGHRATQGQSGQGTNQGLSGRGGLTGTVEKIEGNTLTVNTAQGPLQATVGGDTIIQMFATGTLQDLKAGLRVTVVGERGKDGAVTATSIVITPEGVRGFPGVELPGEPSGGHGQ